MDNNENNVSNKNTDEVVQISSVDSIKNLDDVKKENKTLNNVISIILVLVILGALGFFVYNNFINIGTGPNQTPTNTGNTNSESKDINKIGFEKYNMLYSKKTYSDNTFIFFKDTNVTPSNISNQDKLYLSYSFLSDEDKNKTGVFNEECFLNNGKYTKNDYPSTCAQEKFDKNLLSERIKSNFDSSMTVDFIDFYSTSSNVCFIDNNTYTCYLNKSDYKIMDYTTFMKYEESKLEGDKLEVYNYLLTVRKYPNAIYTKGVYSNASATNKIDDLPFEIGDTINQELTDKLINQYKDKITKYKSTFAKENNNYVWQKTEIIK